MRRTHLHIFVFLLCSGHFLIFTNCLDEEEKNSKTVIAVSEETEFPTTKRSDDEFTTSSILERVYQIGDISISKYKNSSLPSNQDAFILAKKVRTDCPRDDTEYRRLYKGKCGHSANHISAFNKPEDRSISDKDKMEINFQNKRILKWVVSVGVLGAIVPPHAPKLGFELLDMSVSLFSKICSKVPVDFVNNALKLYHDLHWVTGQGRSDVLTEVDFKWIVKILKNCSANAKPFTPQMDHCEEELLGASACRNFICTNPEHEFKLYRSDPLVDMMWKIYEIVHAVCFPAFEESYRMHHKYAQAIMDLFTQPIRVRWFNQLADNVFWRRALGPNYELHLINMERCVQESITRAALPYRLPKHTITDRPRMGGDLGVVMPCVPNYKNVIIQLAIVQDATHTYRGYMQKWASIMPDSLQTIKDTFPKTEIALSSFVDYPWMNINNSTNIEEDAYCYKLWHNLTRDYGHIASAVSSLQIFHGGAGDKLDLAESSLTAVLFTAVDKEMGWASTPFIKGNKVYKVLALSTDEPWKSKDEAYPVDKPEFKPPIRPDCVGDGSDTCENFPPDVKLVRDTMEVRNIYFLGLIAPHQFKTYEGYMGKYKFKAHQHQLVKFSNPKDLPDILVSQFKAMIHWDQCGTQEI